MITALNDDDSDGTAADLRAMRALIDAWAHFADRRDPAAQAGLFVEGGRVLVYSGGRSEPDRQLVGRKELAEAFHVLDTFEVTTHFNGQNTVAVDGDRAHGESFCLAHHVWSVDGVPTLMVMSIRYQDQFVREDGTWRFAERKLIIDREHRGPLLS